MAETHAELIAAAEADLREARELLEAAQTRPALARTDVTVAAERVERFVRLIDWLGRHAEKDGSDDG